MATNYDESVNLPHQYYPAIGEFMFRFAQLENLLHQLLWRCLDIDNKQGRTLTVGTDLSVIIAMLNTATSSTRWVKSNHIIGESGNIIKVAKEYRDLRNQLAHGLWAFPKSGDPQDVWMHYMKETADQRLMPKAKKLPPETMHKASGKLKGALERAKRLIQAVELARPPRELSPPV